jgi:hypothetical protein
MKDSPMLEFESTAFAVTSGEDAKTNPGIYGKALAEWIAEALPARGFDTGEVIAEDFGWLVPVESKPHSLYVVCASEDGETEKWRAFAFAEGGLLARLMGKDRRSESVAALFAALKELIAAGPDVRNLRQDPP